jgi:predicted amidohydrolase
LGHWDDFATPQFCRLLLNAIFWAMNRPAPAAVCGRPVRVVSVAMFNQGIEKTTKAVDREAAAGADLILLTETWTGKKPLASLDDPSIAAMAAIAKNRRTYIVSPVRRKDGETVYNSAILINRKGEIVGVYNKMYSVLPDPPNPQFWFADGKPGHDAMVFDTDFGRIGIAICFDAQFPEVWRRFEEQGAQLVLFASAYSAGRSLESYATLHHYYLISSIRNGECQAYDMTGEKLLDERKSVSRITIDLDRRIFHNNDSYNYRGQENRLLKENPGVVVDKWMTREDWHVLRAVQPGVDLPVLIKTYDLQELRDYLNKQRRQADRLRGYPFNRVGPEPKG